MCLYTHKNKGETGRTNKLAAQLAEPRPSHVVDALEVVAASGDTERGKLGQRARSKVDVGQDVPEDVQSTRMEPVLCLCIREEHPTCAVGEEVAVHSQSGIGVALADEACTLGVSFKGSLDKA